MKLLLLAVNNKLWSEKKKMLQNREEIKSRARGLSETRMCEPKGHREREREEDGDRISLTV